MVHVAMSDAINSVQNRYTRYITTVPADPALRPRRRRRQRRARSCFSSFPNQKTMIDEAYANSLKAIPDGAAKSQGIALGEQVAAAVQADRASDGTKCPDTYRPITSPGVWVPTTPPIFAQYARAKPWVLTSADQFRPGPPPQLSSALYARDYNETKTLGGAKSTTRTAAQTEAVKYWTASGSRPGVANRCAPTVGGEGTWPCRECASVRAPQHGRRQHLHHRLGRQIHLQLLAPGHRDSQRRHGWQRCHRA